MGAQCPLVVVLGERGGGGWENHPKSREVVPKALLEADAPWRIVRQTRDRGRRELLMRKALMTDQ